MIVQPIRFTSSPDAWLHLLDAFGASVVVDADGWHVRALGAGRVAVHAVPPGDPRDGDTALRFASEDLDAELARLHGPVTTAGVVVEDGHAEHGREVTVTAPDGMVLAIDTIDTIDSRAPGADGAPAVLALWMTPDAPGGADLLAALGLRPRIRSAVGDWHDFTAPGAGVDRDAHDGGLVAAHTEEAAPSCVLSFEHDDVAALASRLEAAGIAPAIIDEAYGRSLRVPSPDGGAEIWVNETQTDLYGYLRA